MHTSAQSVIFKSFTNVNNNYVFNYQIDDTSYEISLAHSMASSLANEHLETVLFNLGMCYLVDIVELTIPASITINFNLSELQLSFWKTLYQEVAKEKMYIHNLDLSLLDAKWEINPNAKSFEPFTLVNQKETVSLCLTGGKESLTLLKMLKDKKDLLLFFLNPEMNIHRQRVFDRVKDEFLTVKTISNRPQVFNKIKKKYDTTLGSGVDMAHLVFNTLLFETKYVLIGNEYSSNYPNFVYQGYPINHQYVKSIYFAEKLNAYLSQFVTTDYTYYSPFFGLFEYKIASQLFKNDEYLEVWTSCNKTTATTNFCSNCHKCAFTYLISLIYTSEEYLNRYFSRDLLKDVTLFKDLVDFTGKKPLDCVGEKIEVWVALENLSKQEKYTQKPVIQYFIKNIRPFIANDLPTLEAEVNTIQTVPTSLPVDLDTIIKEAYQE